MSFLGLGRPSTKHSKHPRQSSGQFTAVFDSQQIQTFKEAFNFFDQDGDGWITRSDLIALLTSLGENPSPDRISTLLGARPTTTNQSLFQSSDERINFTMFVTMMSEHLSTMDPEQELLEAFATFDEGNRGLIRPTELRKCLMTEGQCMSEDELNRLLSPPFVTATGDFKYRLFCETLRVTDQESH
ncbi:hypothetical protein OIV83_000091 [Microbotryomycetes sp. JL201]|nr:hypothetical protein OIV83_000091 [Microbotryomycetes sp. JL201]